MMGLIPLLASCTVEPPPPVAVEVSSRTQSFLHDVKPILDTRCVVCHSCYNSACQLQLGSFEGIERGASKLAVYSSSRLRAQDPTRLFMDAQTTEQWREKSFFSVTENTAGGRFNDSILLGLLEAKRRRPVPVGEYHAEATDLTCAANRTELGGFLAEHPNRGMPFGFPILPDEQYVTIGSWLQQGMQGPSIDEQQALVTPSPGAAKQIEAWEAFLNQDDAKHAMTARYLYEHFFLAHVRFTDGGGREFYEMVRSKTPPGQPIDVIATRRPYDDPKVHAIYYRFRKIHSTIVFKTHMVVEFGDDRLARYQELFIDPEWIEAPHRMPLGDRTGANAFLVYAQIPAISRYRFMLDDSEYFIRTFIRGPVCKGQIALDVIHDHFWVLFRDPDRDLTALDSKFLIEQAHNLAIPDERGSDDPVLRTFSDDYRDLDRAFYKAKSALYDKATPDGFSLDSIWKGRRAADAPLLTVYRHFDSASVHKGALGGLPRTMWVIDYSQFERIYYSLVAGFDVFGNVSHQVNVRRYMDLLRIEGELNFVEFLPSKDRLPILRSWYLGSDAIDDVSPQEVLSNRGTLIDYKTDNPKRELIERVVDEHLLPEVGIAFDPINYHERDGEIPAMPKSFKTREDILNGFRALTAPGTEFIRHENGYNVNVIFVRLELAEGDDRFFTIVINRWHDNVNAMFGESMRLDPAKDTIDFIPGGIGVYPNYFFTVDREDLPELFDMLANYDGSEHYRKLLAKFGVNRADPRFWEVYDWFQAQLDEREPLAAGLYDLNRYHFLAVDR
jgi:hypothetical protein